MIFFLILAAVMGIILYLVYNTPSPLLFVLTPYLIMIAALGFFYEQNRVGYASDDIAQLDHNFVINSFLVDDRNKCVYLQLQEILADMTLDAPRLFRVCQSYEKMRKELEQNADKMKNGKFGARFSGARRKLDGSFDLEMEMYQINMIQKAIPKDESHAN